MGDTGVEALGRPVKHLRFYPADTSKVCVHGCVRGYIYICVCVYGRVSVCVRVHTSLWMCVCVRRGD